MKMETQEKIGLNQLEVTERQKLGQQNNYEENISKTTKAIFKDNIFTLFNALNLSIAICLALVGAYSNLAFLVIIGINISIGIYQEIHARNMVAKLAIVSKELAVVIRDSKEQEIEATALVLDDTVKLQAGEQVQADMKIISGNAEVNEALLTGESDLIKKSVGSTLLSGSFLSSGQCLAQVIHVGKDNYATKIASQAKTHKPLNSELIKSIQKVSKFTSYIIIPLGVILLLEGLFIRQSETKMAVVSAAAALLGMLPKGLVLLISIALATAVTKLAQKRILVQDMYAVETLAHVDTLCLDKTGTITEGKMKVHQVRMLNDYSESQFKELIGNYLNASTDNNITIKAIRESYPEKATYQTQSLIPFSSERKWGGVNFTELGALVLGAPEKLMAEELLPESVLRAQEEGYRVLLLAQAESTITDGELPVVTPVALFEIDDPIRENAEETLAYLKAEGIDLKVISGDNPVTVSNIARRAGLPGYASYIDLSTLSDEEAVRGAVNQYSVFGRVSPQQKQLLVNELKNEGHVVAMTGDGVNDVLALREADCSIAMAEGDSATRQIANLVLLDSDFTSLPDVLFEGRRVVNNVTKVASVFFIKTIYSFVLSVLCGITAIAFPFIPIQITLLDLAIEGYPAFFLSFEADRQQVKGQFLPTVLRRAFPNALLIIFNTIAVYLYSAQQGFSQLETTTLLYYLLIAVSLLGVLKACLPLNPLRVFLILSTTIGVYVAVMLFHSLLAIDFLNAHTLPVFLVMLMSSFVLRFLFSKVEKRYQSKE